MRLFFVYMVLCLEIFAVAHLKKQYDWYQNRDTIKENGRGRQMQSEVMIESG